MGKEYWFCLVGPTTRDKLAAGSDFPMRRAVGRAFNETTGHDYEYQWSGWGLSEEQRDAILFALDHAKEVLALR